MMDFDFRKMVGAIVVGNLLTGVSVGILWILLRILFG